MAALESQLRVEADQEHLEFTRQEEVKSCQKAGGQSSDTIGKKSEVAKVGGLGLGGIYPSVL